MPKQEAELQLGLDIRETNGQEGRADTASPIPQGSVVSQLNVNKQAWAD